MPGPHRSREARRRRPQHFLWVLAAVLAFAACPEEEVPQLQPLEGSQAGSQRFVVHLKGDAPDLTAYRQALAEAPDEVPAIVEGLRADAKAQRKGFEQELKAFGGRVVDHWYLTNAVTVEIPANAAPSLPALGGVTRVEPDRPLE